MNVLLVDNFDSFSFNLVDALERLGVHVSVTRNHSPLQRLCARAEEADLVVLSPGPGRPETAGGCVELIRKLAGRTPVLGVCLGHQCLAVAHGGDVATVHPVHGKADPVEHDQRGVFEGLPNPLTVGRYHSLAVTRFSPTFRVQARTRDGVTMAAYDPAARQLGLQFHPESILTPQGQSLLERAVRELAPATRGAS